MNQGAVGKHPPPVRQRRADGLFDMVGAGGGEQQGLGPDRPSSVIATEQESAYCFCAVAPPWLAGDEAVDAALGQSDLEGLQLGRLADPLPAFEADELSAHAIPTSCLKPSQMRPKKPAWSIASPATSGTTCGDVSSV